MKTLGAVLLLVSLGFAEDPIADYLARIGKRGGKSTSAAKAEADRRNGRLGGRPRKAAR